MKLLRYGPKGQEKPGLLDTQGKIRDLSGVVPDIAGDTLLPPSLDRLRRLTPEELPLAQDGARLGACVGRVGKFLCVGLNYSDHAAESNMAVPAEPIIFMKATSSIADPTTTWSFHGDRRRATGKWSWAWSSAPRRNTWPKPTR